jgi:hypothetical protein
MLTYSKTNVCFEHSNLLKVTTRSAFAQHPPEKAGSGREGHAHPHPNSYPNFNYELFNCSNLNIRCWSWNYRGCWHQTCPPIDPRWTLYPSLILISVVKPPPINYLLSLPRPPDHWVIYAPAAFLGCGSRLSGSLSGIEP